MPITNLANTYLAKKEFTMSEQKIAFPTDDGETISRHFGRAPYFKVIALENGAVAATEMRGNPADEGHAHTHDHAHSHDRGQGHGAKFALVADCQVLIGGGMGQPAYDRLQAMGLSVYLIGEKSITAALAQYQAGGLTSDLRRVHAHHHHDDHGHEPIHLDTPG